jgi:hypothetical protein
VSVLVDLVDLCAHRQAVDHLGLFLAKLLQQFEFDEELTELLQRDPLPFI